LHEQLAAYLERQIAAGALTEAPLLDTLVYHYDRSDNPAKQRAYLKKAGQAALDVTASNSAREYFARLLELTPEDDPERSALALKLAEACGYLDDFPTSRAAIDQAQAAAKTDADRASALAYLGEMLSTLGDYSEAQTILAEAVPLARVSGDSLTLCRALYALGDVNWRLGKLDDAKVALDESLTLARALEKENLYYELYALNRLGTVAFTKGILDEAERLFTEFHMRAVAAGNRGVILTALNNLGEVRKEQKEYATARDHFQQMMALSREIGSQAPIALGLINLADIDIKLGQLAEARTKLREALAIAERIGFLPWAVLAVGNFSNLAHAEGQTERALALWNLARHHPALKSDDQRALDRMLAEWALDPSVAEAGMRKGAELDWDETVKELLQG